MDSETIRQNIVHLEKMEGTLSKMDMPTFSLRMSIDNLRIQMLGIIPFLEVQYLVIQEEEPQGHD